MTGATRAKFFACLACDSARQEFLGRPPHAKLSGNVVADSNAFHRELVKFYQSFEARFGAWFEGKDLPEAAAHSLSSLFQLCGEGFLRLALDALPIKS
jgi:hypothetical protein